MTRTFDNARKIKPFGIIDVDASFHSWFNDKLNLQVKAPNDVVKKVPVIFVAPERWHSAREEPIREAEGSLVLPIITLSRTNISTGNEAGYERIFADIKQDHVYYKQIDSKSSLMKEMEIRAYQSGSDFDPSVPVYEMYTHRAPDHYTFDYEVMIWSSNIEEMNEILQKISQEYDFLSVKSFNFKMPTGFYHVAFQQDSIDDDSNLSDYTGKERIIKKTLTYRVPVNLIPESNQRRDQLRRYWSQSKLVMKQHVAISQADFDKFIGKK